MVANQKHAAVGAFLIAVATILGAFGAHALKDRFTGNQEEIWKTAVFYQMVNALGILFISLIKTDQQRLSKILKICCGLLISGILIFSGSLYILVLTNQRWLGAITPVGGSLLIFAWLLLAFNLMRAKQ